MAQKRVTIQQIADACRLSRNTVSKIFNQRGSVPERTRQLVLGKAHELGYFDQESLASNQGQSVGNIAVLSRINPLNHNFGSMLIKSFTDAVCRSGYSVQLYELSAEEIRLRQLPGQIDRDNTVGVLCIELFDEAYLRMLSELGLPMVSIDAYCSANRAQIFCDIITMENVSSTMRLTEQMIRAGARRLGFVGDILHCNSFHERWGGFCAALRNAGLQPDARLCILERDGPHYADLEWTATQLRQLPELPEAFVCANDYHAIKLIQGLKRIGCAVPGDVMVAGFDNTPESSIIEPGLTTVNIHSAEMGVLAAENLLARCRSAARPHCLVYVQTEPIFRASTRAN